MTRDELLMALDQGGDHEHMGALLDEYERTPRLPDDVDEGAIYEMSVPARLRAAAELVEVCDDLEKAGMRSEAREKARLAMNAAENAAVDVRGLFISLGGEIWW
jgi:hypothetical protein